MSEPEVALAFTADIWVEELHRHLSDHGGARVRTLVVVDDAERDETDEEGPQHQCKQEEGHEGKLLTRAAPRARSGMG